MKIKGSALIVRGDTKEEVIEFLKKDIYSTSGVWDWEKVSLVGYFIELRLKSKEQVFICYVSYVEFLNFGTGNC